MKSINIAESEWEVMMVVWEKAPVPAGEIVKVLEKKKGWRERTTRTLLDRLVKKELLRIKNETRPSLYEARVSMETALRQESRSFLDRVFGGEPVSMLLRLVDEANLSREDIQKLKDVLSKKGK
jgi:BlaI family penicillinase repressor